MAPEINPISPRLVAPHAVRADRVMSPAQNFFRFAPGQHLDGMLQTGAEPALLPQPHHATEQLLDVGRGVPFFARREALIAGAAVVHGPLLPEVTEKGHAAATLVLGEMRHLLELRPRLAASLQVGDLLEKAQILHHVAARVEEEAFGRQPVPPGAAGFLIVALHVLG